MRLLKKSTLSSLFVLLTYLGLAIVMTWPVAGVIGQRIPGSDGDSFIRLWTADWVRDSLITGNPLFYTQRIFYPQGVSLATHNIDWLNIAGWLPIQLIVGEAAAYSLMFLGIYTLNGFATYLLVQEFVQSKVAAFTSGLVVAFWPMIVSHNHQPNLIFIAWIPFTLLFFKRTIERQRLSDALITAVFVALMGITRWQLLILGGVLLASYYVYMLLSQHSYRNRRVFMLTGLIGVVSLLIIAPFIRMPLRSLLLSYDSIDYTDLTSNASTDLLAYVIPSRYHPLWGPEMASRFYANLDGAITSQRVPFIGYTVLLLAAYGTFKEWRRARFWLFATLLLVLLALGPRLHVNGISLFPLPYQLLDKLFIFRMVRHPLRFAIIMAIPVAMLVAYGVKSLQCHSKMGTRSKSVALAMAIGLILFEYVATIPTLDLDVPIWFETLAEEKGNFAILNLPMNNRSHIENYMYYQLVHGKPLVGGKIARPTEESFTFIDSLPMLNRYSDEIGPPVDQVSVGFQLSILADAGVRYLILHKSKLNLEELVAWRAWLGVDPIHEDEDLVVYPTSFDVGLDTTLATTNVAGLGIINWSANQKAEPIDDIIELVIHWGSESSLDRDYTVCLNLVSSDGTVESRKCQPLSESRPTSLWQDNEIVREQYTVNMGPLRNRGRYSLQMQVNEDGHESEMADALVIGEVELDDRLHIFAVNNSLSLDKAEPRWDNFVALNDYSVSKFSERNLTVQLRWQALQSMETSYKYFLHLVDTNSGQRVKQVDKVPGKQSYPTTVWSASELIDDTIELNLDSIGEGEYELWLGLYDETTMERLQIEADSTGSWIILDDAILLLEFDR